MTEELELTAFDGTTPLGFLAALGVLDVAHRAGRDARLRWVGEIEPVAVLGGVADGDELVLLLDSDRERWGSDLVLHGSEAEPLLDIKPEREQIAEWAGGLQERLPSLWAEPEGGAPFEWAAADLFCALLSEGALDNNGKGKPTHLHFTAGQQKFLAMVRELATNVDAERLREAVFGPWREDSPLPSLSWHAGSDRVYALRAVNPSTDKRHGVPGADWLAFLGLSFYPTRLSTSHGRFTLETSACDRAWKESAFRWPLWTDPLDRDTIRSVVALPDLVGPGKGPGPATLSVWGIDRVLSARISRSAQGGYGSFSGASTHAAGGPQVGVEV